MQIVFGTALPLGTALPPYWKQVKQSLAAVPDDLKKERLLGLECYCPVSLRWEGESEWWQLPIDPVVAVRGRNTIVKRNVLKVQTSDKARRGTVKELWSQGDYEVSIAGVLQSGDECRMPEDDIRKLRNYCEGRESVEVLSPLLTLFDISRLAIESFDFPHTAGLENQRYTLTCQSDDFYKESLLIAD